MPVTRNNVALQQAIWTDVYTSAGITVGREVLVMNKGSKACFLAIKDSSPTSSNFGVPLLTGESNRAFVDAGEVGLWAYCPDGVTYLVVQEL